MSRNVSMQFGKSGGVVQNRPGFKFIRGGEVTDNTAEVLSFEPGGIYVLYAKAFRQDTGAYYGLYCYVIAAPEEELYGTTASAHINWTSGGGISITWNSDSTVTLTQSSATYNFRYALYRVDGQGS